MLLIVELALFSSFFLVLNPKHLFGNKLGSGVGKLYNNYFIVRLIRNDDNPLPD